MGTAANHVDSSSDKEVARPASSTDVAAVVPEWLSARRAKPFAAATSTQSSLPEKPLADAAPPGWPISDSPTKAYGHRKKSLHERINECLVPGASLWVVLGAWMHQLSQQYGSAMIGVSISTAAHAVAVVSLAVIYVSGGVENVGLNIFGSMNNAAEVELADINLDSTLQLDSGQDAAPLVFPELSQIVSPDAIGFEPGEALQGKLTGVGKGKGDGESGEGDALQVPTVNIPSYAVTKGSFSAWTEPRDPDPGRQYHIVIQVRVPTHITKYRATDLSGMVTGTDRYKQVIKFRTTDEFPIKDGTVQIRIAVPGADKLVRDTIRIESKVLREKQTIHIVF